MNGNHGRVLVTGGASLYRRYNGGCSDKGRHTGREVGNFSGDKREIIQLHLNASAIESITSDLVDCSWRRGR